MYCNQCGMLLSSRARFCNRCGQPQGQGVPAPATPPDAVDPLAPTLPMTNGGPANARGSGSAGGAGGVILQPPANLPRIRVPSLRVPGVRGAHAAPRAKSELRAALLEFFLPGAGLVYAGKIVKGLITFCATVLATFVALGIYDEVVRRAVTAGCTQSAISAGACGVPNYSGANVCFLLFWLLFSLWTALRVRAAVRTLRLRNAARRQPQGPYAPPRSR